MVIAAGLPGIVFPNLTHETGVNVVVYVDALGSGNLIEVNDPDGRLPKDRASWAE